MSGDHDHCLPYYCYVAASDGEWWRLGGALATADDRANRLGADLLAAVAADRSIEPHATAYRAAAAEVVAAEAACDARRADLAPCPASAR